MGINKEDFEDMANCNMGYEYVDAYERAVTGKQALGLKP